MKTQYLAIVAAALACRIEPAPSSAPTPTEPFCRSGDLTACAIERECAAGIDAACEKIGRHGPNWSHPVDVNGDPNRVLSSGTGGSPMNLPPPAP